jgi:uncharacterized membrane protein
MSKAKTILLWVMGIGYVLAGLNHFLNPAIYLQMMPPYLPWHAELVAISGVLEILGGVGVLVPRTRRLAAWGLIALLIAVFPANLYLALNEVPFGNSVPPRWAMWLRLPFQLLFIAWAYWYARAPRVPRSRGGGVAGG